MCFAQLLAGVGFSVSCQATNESSRSLVLLLVILLTVDKNEQSYTKGLKESLSV